GGLVDHGTPGGVDDEGGVLHSLELLRTHQMEGRGEQRGVDDDEIGLCIQLLRRRHGDPQSLDIRLLHIGIRGQNVHLKAGELLHHQPGDLAHADDAHRGALQLDGLVGVALFELAGPGQLIHLHRPLGQCQQQHHDMLRHGVQVGVGGVDHQDPLFRGVIHRDIVHAHAVLGDYLQRRDGVHDLRRDLRRTDQDRGASLRLPDDLAALRGSALHDLEILP
ncbi:thiaminase II, partial [Dysosmobacter welbionis]